MNGAQVEDVTRAKAFEAKHESLSDLVGVTSSGFALEASMADYEVRGGGSVFILVPLNDQATENLEENVGEETMWFAGGIAVELTRKGNEETHLETAEFIHEIRCGEWTFKLHCLAYKRHPGVIAADMKKRKEDV